MGRIYLSICIHMNSQINLINTNSKCCNIGYPYDRDACLPFSDYQLLAIHRTENMIDFCNRDQTSIFPLCVCVCVGV